MSPELTLGLMFGLLLLLLASGLPIVWAMGGIAMIFIYFLLGPDSLLLVVKRGWDTMTSFVLLCLPLFVFMGVMLERSGMASDLFKMMHVWSGRIRGSLGAGTVVICMIFAAMTGLSAAATLTMGLVALPEMLKRNYNKNMALGPILAGGALGVLIPPSVTMIIYAIVAGVSVGKLFMGGILPGIILGLLFIAYIIVRAAIQPRVAPALPPEESSGWPEKIASLRAVILPLLLIITVMGSIFLGIATPTEAAAIGALGATICAAIYRKLNWQVIKDACLNTLLVCGMAMWVFTAARALYTIYFAIGATDVVEGLLLGVPGGTWGIIIAIQAIWLILGMFMDPWGIIMITGPLFCPLVESLGFNMVWFGVVYVVNMEMAYITPPVGANLFYLKGVAPPEVSLTDIYRSVWPFVLLQLVGLALVLGFSQLALWLPSMMIG